MTSSILVALLFAALVIFVISKTAIVIPQQSAYIVERLGKYSATLPAGFHILIPFMDRVRYKHSLKEVVIDTAEQVCVTVDNVQVKVDGVIYLRVLDPRLVSYGVDDYIYAVTQLVQTALRSEIGKIELDKTFEVRDSINMAVVQHLDEATEPWGLKVLRFEIQNITPPREVLDAMEEQAKAERRKRAAVLDSEGIRDAHINQAEGEKQRVIRASEADRERQINEAHGEAEAILAVARATAEGLREIGEAAQEAGGKEAMQLRIAEQFVSEFGKLAKESNTMIVPANLADISSMIKLATDAIGGDKGKLRVVGDES